LLAHLGDALGSLAGSLGGRFGAYGHRLFGSRPADGRQVRGVFASAWPIGTTALWIAVLLTSYIFFYYLD
jgi:multicomponent Na+:H+ antiporter subunit D